MEWLDKPIITFGLGNAVVTLAAGTIIFWFFPALGWAAVDFGFSSVRGDGGGGSPAAVFFYSALFGSLAWVGQLIHEFGHALAFRFYGQRVEEIHLGARNWTVGTAPSLRSTMIKCLVAGPAVHIVYGVVLLLIGTVAGGNILLLAVGSVVIFSALVGFFPLVPGSDGAMIRDLRRDDR
ncbi:hypothetical protein IV498_10105 [Paenarthrobacter sp. Z7-10]|uniref:hypothetical protein n=1 Tax=Paenarthrobacter sp. Z7-10 TaxID=2787635 RepID=UPI0022A99128|nr:hypothetical protein [Paenarthrobacter sp. Z7-10]MCZ2403523.1 hypothetical protein [Paenarthrobacter sp. Z7-10]